MFYALAALLGLAGGYWFRGTQETAKLKAFYNRLLTAASKEEGTLRSELGAVLTDIKKIF